MNIQVQCCGIILLFTLFIFYMNQDKLQLITEKIFTRTFIVAFFSIVLDILSIIAITNMEHLPMLLVEFIAKIYPASLVCIVACCLMYVYVDIFYQSPNYKSITKGFLIVLSTILAFIFALPIYYHYQPEMGELYTYGPSVSFTYAAVFGYIILILFIMMRQRHRINPNRFQAVLIWLLLWITAAVIQALHPKLLLVGYAACLGILILYIRLENPEANINRKTGLFNENALLLYLRQLYLETKSFSVISITFEQTSDQISLIEDDYQNLSGFTKHLRQSKDIKIFNRAHDIFLISKNVNNIEHDAASIKNFLEEWLLSRMNRVTAKMLVLPNADKLHNEEDLLYLLNYSLDQYAEHKDNTLVTIDDAIIDKMYEEKKIIKHILYAIDTKCVEVFYQPIYSTAEKAFISAEALIRIRDDEGKIISPAVFIPIAEKNGMIIKLGDIVFEKVCAFAVEKNLRQYGIQYIEVNLSVLQCADNQLAKRFISIMEKYHIDSKMINLEITESASIEKKMILLQNMKQLMDYGVSFSLDDFGTGQSNLNYIMDMPVEIVKFDREMSNAYFTNTKGTYIMDAAIHMVHGMGLDIVSEGIETEEQYKRIEDLGIRYVQGYYFSKPLPEEEFLEFIRAN